MGRLPFPYDALVLAVDGTELGAVRCAWWPADRRSAVRAGSEWDHTGEAPLSAYDLLAAPNRRLAVAGGPTFGIVSASRQVFLPHTTLLLRQVADA